MTIYIDVAVFYFKSVGYVAFDVGNAGGDTYGDSFPAIQKRSVTLTSPTELPVGFSYQLLPTKMTRNR